jgi:hypothetical protein
MYFIFFIFFSFSALSEETLHLHPKWLRLLHYKKSFSGKYISEADSKAFFLSLNGKSDPKAELEKSMEIFSQSAHLDDQHPICKFPLRYKWLNQELGYPWKANLSNCKNYLAFFSKLAAKRASLVFSSYYLTNPNSAFGHTLLRLSRYDDRNETEMLDYGINYAAQAQEANPFLYAVKGLFGGFIGKFAAIPYYYKVREYSDFEFRDLWSFDLKFTMPEVLEMVDHIWELGNTHFDYFYFRENCSYHLLSILEVARPSLILTDSYPIYTIPADTVRLLHQKGLIDEGRRRPSTYSRLLRLSAQLSASELKEAKAVANDPPLAREINNKYSMERAAQVLDVTMEAFDYFNFEKILKDNPEARELKSHILSERAKNPVITSGENTSNDSDSPAFSHSPTRLVFSGNYYRHQGKSLRFEMRPALHDLLDPPRGSLKDAQLEIGKVSFELQDQQYSNPQVVLDNFSIFNIKNYQQQNFWSSPFSWEIDLGAKQLRRMGCFNCPAGFVTGSIGNSIALGEDILFVILMNGEIDFQSQFINNHRMALGPRLLTRLRFSDNWMALLNSTYHFNTYEYEKMFQDYEWWSEVELRHHLSEKVSLGFKGGAIERSRFWQTFGEVSLFYFYH